VKGPAGHASKLKSLIDKHAPAEPPPHPQWSEEFGSDPVNVFVHSVLAWEAPLAMADAAFAKLASKLYDWNDLRVCLVDETMEIVGPRYPNAFTRLRILRNSLTAIYKRQHKVDLGHLESAGKREARTYLEGIPELPAFVAHRTLLLRFKHSVMPIDRRLLEKLQDAGVVAAEASESDAATWIAKELSSDRLVAAYHALHAFADSTPDRPVKAEPSAKKESKAGGKKSSKKEAAPEPKKDPPKKAAPAAKAAPAKPAAKPSPKKKVATKAPAVKKAATKAPAAKKASKKAGSPKSTKKK
jgi:hypothetical protein